MVKVIRVWKGAADQGRVKAQLNLGAMYYQGQGVPKSYKEALVWCLEAADQGNVEAQFNLGFMYQQGQGVVQSCKEAAVWCRKAADQGLAEAQYIMAPCIKRPWRAQEYRGSSVVVSKGGNTATQGYKVALERMAELEATWASAGLEPGGCANCGAHQDPGGAALKPYSRCKDVVYCGREC